MLESARLRRNGARWGFETEADLEDFVWQNLNSLLSLTPIRRQYSVKGQVCDIVATKEDKSLVIVELKNAEDRGIVQQLTRYYDAFQEEKPFQDTIAYAQPVSLIAIAPIFHRDSFVDIKYHKLFFEFLSFEIIENGEKFYFCLAHADTRNFVKLEIPYSIPKSTDDIPSPPRALRNLLAKCSPEQQAGILEARRQILSFDSRIQEVVETGCIKYGRGKSKPCCELRFDSERNSPALFLWLPHASTWQKRRFVARMRVWTDWKLVSAVGHVPKALGRMITEEEWRSGTARPLRKLTKGKFLHSATHKSPLAMSIQEYMRLVNEPEPLDSLGHLIDMATAQWLNRL